ncbi:MAG: hypothetical protein IJ737_04435 [Ruminococcus sp.]|nr:hypothetical protein [Ruminococcus sp.]
MLHGYFDLPTFNFFDSGNIWTGSMFRDFSYRIVPKKVKKGEEGESSLYLCIWYGTQCITKVDRFECEHSEEFSAEGLDRIYSKLNEEFEVFKVKRKEK